MVHFDWMISLTNGMRVNILRVSISMKQWFIEPIRPDRRGPPKNHLFLSPIPVSSNKPTLIVPHTFSPTILSIHHGSENNYNHRQPSISSAAARLQQWRSVAVAFAVALDVENFESSRLGTFTTQAWCRVVGIIQRCIGLSRDGLSCPGRRWEIFSWRNLCHGGIAGFENKEKGIAADAQRSQE